MKCDIISGDIASNMNWVFVFALIQMTSHRFLCNLIPQIKSANHIVQSTYNIIKFVYYSKIKMCKKKCVNRIIWLKATDKQVGQDADCAQGEKGNSKNT